jgi:hydrogenase maturation factor HypE
MKAQKLSPSAATIAYLATREALEVAEKALAEAEAMMKVSFAQNGVDRAVANGVQVAIVSGSRPSYDVEKLADLVSPKVLKTVTKLAVDGKKFKSAVEVGMIQADVAESVTKVTEYEQVRVTELNKAVAVQGKGVVTQVA